MSTKPDMTMEDFLRIASTYDHNDPEIFRQGWSLYSDTSLQKRAEERYGADWGQRIVMHSEHEEALRILLEREPKQLEVWDSLSGRIPVKATGTTGMATIRAAERKQGVPIPPQPPKPPTPPVTPPVTPPQPPVVPPEETAAREKLARLENLAEDIRAAIALEFPRRGGGRWVNLLRGLTAMILEA